METVCGNKCHQANAKTFLFVNINIINNIIEVLVGIFNSQESPRKHWLPIRVYLTRKGYNQTVGGHTGIFGKAVLMKGILKGHFSEGNFVKGIA